MILFCTIISIKISTVEGGGEKVKKVFIFGLAFLFATGLSTTVIAFHEGGVARCNGCHTMHNSQEGALVDVGLAPVTGGWPLSGDVVGLAPVSSEGLLSI